MKDTLIQLFKDYFKTDLIQKKVIIIGEGQKQQIHIIDALMPLEWNMVKQSGEPDIQAAESLLERRRSMKAKQIFRITSSILKFKKMKADWNREWTNPEPSVDKSPHEELMQYSEGALYFLDVITPYDYTEMSAILDEKGIFQGVQVHPKHQEDITEGALEVQR